MGAIGVFEADANAGKLSAEAAANNGFELEKSIDRAIFRAKERFGAYLANSKSRPEWEERWEQVKPQVIRVIAEVTTPTPGVIRRVGAALRPPVRAQAPAKKNRPSTTAPTAKTARNESGTPWLPAGDSVDIRRGIDAALLSEAASHGSVEKFAHHVAEAAKVAVKAAKEASLRKAAWIYDREAKLWTSADPMQKFACPDCGTEQHIGFSHCAGCDRTWNSWAVRQAGTDKTSANTYVLMAREIKMRGDQFKLASDGTLKIAESKDEKKDDDGKDTPFDTSDKGDKDDDNKKTAAGPGMPMGQPNFGTMPGDNSGATGAPAAPAQPATPAAGPGMGDRDGDGDVAGGVTEDSPIDQIQDALQDAVMALKEVQMLSINPALTMTASSKSAKVSALRTSMDRFWKLHKEMNYIAGMLAKEANEAIRSADPRITSEAMFVQGFEAAAKNSPLPDNAGREYLEGYVAFFKQAEDYSTGANIGGDFRPGGQDESVGSGRNEGTYLKDSLDDASNNQAGNEGPADGEAASNFAAHEDRVNSAGQSRGDQGESSSMKFTGARRSR